MGVRYCPLCGSAMTKEYLFKRFEDEAKYFHFICTNCGYTDDTLHMKTTGFDEIPQKLLVVDEAKITIAFIFNGHTYTETFTVRLDDITEFRKELLFGAIMHIKVEPITSAKVIE